MYASDGQEYAVAISAFPTMSTGAPEPILVATDGSLLLAYRTIAEQGRACAVIEFIDPHAHFFGPPGDEALIGHPLYGRGLECYRAHEVHFSPWTHSIERANRIHPRHDPKLFERLRHFVFTFHDATFECLAGSFRLVRHEASNGPADLLRSGALRSRSQSAI